MPTIFFYLMFMTLTLLPWYTGILLAAAEFFGMHHVCGLSHFSHSLEIYAFNRL
jgi:hypothetical protein